MTSKINFQNEKVSWRATFLIAAAVTIACAFPIAVVRGQVPATEPAAVPTYEQEIANGRDFMRRRRFEDALKAFKRANELKGQTSAEAFYLMADAYMGLEAYKNVVQTSDKVIELAANDPTMQAQAYNLKGIAIQKQSGGKDAKKLADAEAALRQATALNTKFADAHYNLGVVLMQESRDAEGIVELKQYVQMAPEAFNSAGARKMIENPRRAREPFAPDFSMTTADGEYISLDDLRGKVVVLDFWGTWCPPCVASLPGLRDLNKKYSKDNSFVMISISSDSDGDKWKAFITQEKMVWHQFLDRDRTIQRAFAIHAFPTYIVLDHDGVIRYRSTGLSLERESALEDAVRKQLKVLPKLAASKSQ